MFFDRVPELWWEIVADDRGDWWVGFSWWATGGLVASDPCADFAYFCHEGIVGF